MRHTDTAVCTCASCIAKAFQLKRKGHPYLSTSEVWVRDRGRWFPGKVVKLARVYIHVGYTDANGRPIVAAIDPKGPDPRIRPRSVPYEELPR